MFEKYITKISKAVAFSLGIAPMVYSAGCSDGCSGSSSSFIHATTQDAGDIKNISDYGNIGSDSSDAHITPPLWERGDIPEEDAGPVSESCNTFGSLEECVRGGYEGVCATGSRICFGTFDSYIWSSCQNFGHPGIEVCDGLDNDCNGKIDESYRLEEIPTFSPYYNPNDPDAFERIYANCFDGERESIKVSACQAGRQYCSEGEDSSFAIQGECYGQVLPKAEICNGVDDDCNEVIDDIIVDDTLQGDVTLGDPCTIREIEDIALASVGECKPGTWTCIYDPACELDAETGRPYQPCDAIENPICIEEKFPADEICDFLDNDCNGEVDNGIGVCNCDSPDFVSSPEVCDGIDNDCDGFIDNTAFGVNEVLNSRCYHDHNTGELILPDIDGIEIPDFIAPCRPGFAVCEARHNLGQIAYDYWNCAGERRPSPERCDGEDNNCNNLIDEGFNGGRIIVGIFVDVSGSMQELEITTAVEAGTSAIQTMHANDLLDGVIDQNICYILGVVGSDDPLLISPAHGCVPGVSNDGANLETALDNLRIGLNNRNMSFGIGAPEGTYDAIADFVSDDIIQDVEWNYVEIDINNINPHRQTNIDFLPGDIRYIIIFGDETGQSNRGLTENDVAELVHDPQISATVYLISPRVAENNASEVVSTYGNILPQRQDPCDWENENDLCCLYNDIRDTCEYHMIVSRQDDAERQAVADGIVSFLGEVECLANLPDVEDEN